MIPDLAVGVKYVYRNYGEVIEDFLCMNDGTYCVGNPGEGIMERVFTLDYATTYPAPKPKRMSSPTACTRMPSFWASPCRSPPGSRRSARAPR